MTRSRNKSNVTTPKSPSPASNHIENPSNGRANTTTIAAAMYNPDRRKTLYWPVKTIMNNGMRTMATPLPLARHPSAAQTPNDTASRREPVRNYPAIQYAASSAIAAITISTITELLRLTTVGVARNRRMAPKETGVDARVATMV